MKREPSVLVRLIAKSVAVAAILLVPLAYASPPDSSWSPGIYDDADFDDVVALVMSSESVGNQADTADSRWGLTVVGQALPGDTPIVAAFADVSADPRAPPLS